MIGLTEPHCKGRVHDACGIAGFINVDGTLENGDRIRKMITTMVERENGLGAGYAVYGLFPEFKDYYCLQFLLDDEKAKERLEEYFGKVVDIEKDEKVYTRPLKTLKRPYPLVWRYFVDPEKRMKEAHGEDKDSCIRRAVMYINESIPGVLCLSSGKDMAVFKGNGWCYEIADFYDIERYKGFMWIAHSRFPTNAPGWWGGAHPFNILGWSISHNGEITSYGTNKHYVEMHGYKCTLLTDSEVVAYLWDLLVEKHRLPIPLASIAFAPPYYHEIREMPKNQQLLINALRATYKSAMINGPFSIVVGANQPIPTLIGLTDRKKLRPITAGIDGKRVLLSSEESAIRRVAEDPDIETWAPKAGTPVIAQIDNGLVSKGLEDPFKGMKITIPSKEAQIRDIKR